ncbi:MAG: hypothetical protein AAF616_00665 [Bacteroidota bacterium]
MKTIIKFFTVFTLLNVAAQQSVMESQYAAYLMSSKSMWEKSVSLAAEKHGKESFERALALYGLLSNTMATQDEETFDTYKDETIDLLKKLVEDNPDAGEPKALLSSTYGLAMAYSPMKGMFLGMKSTSLIEEAIEQQPGSALVQKLWAGSKLYTPEMFGGDPEEAVISFAKATDLYSKDPDRNWLYLDALMGLAMAYQKTDAAQKAQSTLEKAVAIEPNFYWAKAELSKMMGASAQDQ